MRLFDIRVVCFYYLQSVLSSAFSFHVELLPRGGYGIFDNHGRQRIFQGINLATLGSTLPIDPEHRRHTVNRIGILPGLAIVLAEHALVANPIGFVGRAKERSTLWRHRLPDRCASALPWARLFDPPAAQP